MAACVDDPQHPNFKHYCRVCKKGFMCGRALGGHMRAHGIGDENGNLDDDDTVSDWDAEIRSNNNNNNNNNSNNSKRMYQLRTNPNRLKSCRTCENCGKEFLSWKSFLEHGKCSSSDASDSLVSSPDEEYSGDDGRRGGGGGGGGGGWSKRKRSLRSKVGYNSPISEDDDLLLARCLVQLANTTVEPPGAGVAEPEESCASASREEERRNPRTSYFAPPRNIRSTTAMYDNNNNHHQKAAKGASAPKGLFECKACKKVFNSHQALGGHRASHKKVKGCYAAKQDQIAEDAALFLQPPPPQEDDVITNEEMLLPPSKFEQGGGGGPPPPVLVGAARRKSKVHECSICHRVFNSGQALGGHKRCHWITSNINSPDTTTSNSLPKFHFQDNVIDQPNNNTNGNNNNNKFRADVADKLDLNVPAWANVAGVRRDPRNPLSFEVSTDMQLQPHGHPQQLQLIKKGELNNNNINTNNNNSKINNMKNDKYVDDEVDSKSKFAKLSDLKEMDTSGSSSQWLQVGIGSTIEGGDA